MNKNERKLDNNKNEPNTDELNKRKTQTNKKWNQNQQLLIKVAQNFKLLEQENKQLRQIAESKKLTNKDQKKILRLYNYDKWSQFMEWIDEKLAECGQFIGKQQVSEQQEMSIKRVLSEILEEPDFQQSYTLDDNKDVTLKPNANSDSISTKKQKKSQESGLLAIENAKLRRQNIKLKAKLNQIKGTYENPDRRIIRY